MLSVVARNTKRIMQLKGIKQKKVAADAGYSEKKFSAMMCGRKIITDTDIPNISNALGVTPNDLFDDNINTLQS